MKYGAVVEYKMVEYKIKLVLIFLLFGGLKVRADKGFIL